MDNNDACIAKEQQKPILVTLIERLSAKINIIDDRLFTNHDIITEINSNIKNISGLDGLPKFITELSKLADSKDVPCILEIMQNNIDKLDSVILLLENMVERQAKINSNLKQIA